MLMTLDPKLPDWVFPPPGGFTAGDLDRIPDLPPHTELIDGSLVFVSPQALFHAFIVELLTYKLRAAAPPGIAVRREMTMTLAPSQRPEPDISVIECSTEPDLASTDVEAAAAVLAVEVVSPESRTRDRDRKPQLYAEAGIKHFWRVENEDGNAVVYIYELDVVTKKYVATDIQRGTLKIDVPFAVEIDLGEVRNWR